MIDKEWLAENLERLDRAHLAARCVDILLRDVGPGSPMLMQFSGEQGNERQGYELDPGESPELMQAFKNFLQQRVPKLLHETIDDLVDSVEIEDEELHIWRAMKVSPEWLAEGLDQGGLGVCWAFDPSGAVAHDGAGGDESLDVRLHAKVNLYFVDWSETIVLNTVDVYTVGEENEIRLKPEASVALLSVTNQESGHVLFEAGWNAKHLSVSEEGSYAKALGL